MLAHLIQAHHLCPHSNQCVCGTTEKSPHNFDDGVVTKPATHTEIGAMTYTCSDCGYTQTEEIAKTLEHSFEVWKADADGINHSKNCVCGASEKMAHQFDSGVITKPSTHTETGIKSYTCRICRAVKEEVIEKLEKKTNVTLYAVIGGAVIVICIPTVMFISKKKHR